MLTTMKQYPNPLQWAAFTLIGEADWRFANSSELVGTAHPTLGMSTLCAQN
jgi:hypothetical protein